MSKTDKRKVEPLRLEDLKEGEVYAYLWEGKINGKVRFSFTTDVEFGKFLVKPDNCNEDSPKFFYNLTHAEDYLAQSEEEEEDSLSPDDLPYFEDVASVLGEERAERELNKVIETGVINKDYLGRDLSSGFVWGNSPQGWKFWSEVEDKILELNKLTPQELSCFEDVAFVLGEDLAEYELNKVIEEGLIEKRRVPLGLEACFIWDTSPQGKEFWEEVHDKIIERDTLVAEDLGIWEDVKVILGEEEAKEQLELVLEDWRNGWGLGVVVDTPVIKSAFTWAVSPQGHDYWSGVSKAQEQLNKIRKEVKCKAMK